MKRNAVLIIIFMFASIAYAETESDVESDVSNTTSTGISNATGIKVKYINVFEEDYRKPRAQNSQNETGNVSAQNTADAANQSNSGAKQDLTKEEINAQFKERYKVLISK